LYYFHKKLKIKKNQKKTFLVGFFDVFLGVFRMGFFGWCAAKAFFSCPAIISRRPGSQNTSKEPQLNSEKDSRRKQARSHVTLEKSS
jgi:hypothetical protein